MSEHQPPGGTPEYLEYGGGDPLPPEPPGDTPDAPRARRSRRAWWIGGGVVALLGVGAGAWAALNFFQQGAQPAEALPASTVAYLSVDLDPAGGQKIDAFRTLNKFPAFKDEVGIDSVDELRHKLGDELVSQSDCPGLDYDDDIDPWLGDRAAVALVDLPGGDPDTVVVVQVKDDDQARAGLKLLDGCETDNTGDTTGYVVRNGWAVLADDQEFADKVSDAAAKGTLADDPTYQKWTKALGEAGVVNAYASPDAGRLLAQKMGGLFDSNLVTEGMAGAASSGAVPGSYQVTVAGDPGDDPFTDVLSGFKGGAATLRFTGDGVELAVAGDGSDENLSEITGNTGGQLVQRLPDDTAGALAITFPKGFLDRQLDQMSQMFGSGMSKDDLVRELSQETGLEIPGDVETLLGSGVTISMSKDFDFEAAENSEDASGLPIAMTVKGDPPAIDQVLDKIRAKTGDLAFLDSDSKDDLEVIGPAPAYRRQVLDGGHLGGNDAFQSVIPDAADASSVFFVNIDAFEPSIEKAAAGDQETVDNVTPLKAVGFSTWNDGGVVRFSFKVSVN